MAPNLLTVIPYSVCRTPSAIKMLGNIKHELRGELFVVPQREDEIRTVKKLIRFQEGECLIQPATDWKMLKRCRGQIVDFEVVAFNKYVHISIKLV